MTVNVEDYFQVQAFNRYVTARHWSRYESRVAPQTERILNLLDETHNRATFFVYGWIAEKFPSLIRSIVERGHEVATRGYRPESLDRATRNSFTNDLEKSRTILEGILGKQVLGFRLGEGWLRPHELWVLDVLAERGFVYDSSIVPLFGRYVGEHSRRTVHHAMTANGPLTEWPISTTTLFGVPIPIGGGNWVRQLPKRFIDCAIEAWNHEQPAPLVMYFHTWELDPDQPRFESTSWLTRVRHYRNLAQMPDRVHQYLTDHRFTSIADRMSCEAATINTNLRVDTPPPRQGLTDLDIQHVTLTPVSIVIPLYNEEPVIPYLANTLAEVRATFVDAGYQPEFVLVNDGSRDATSEKVNEKFVGQPDVRLIEHDRNRGVAAAIMTGIRAAAHDIVGSMDADCTYDPHELVKMIPLLTPDVDLVTASPYHPAGHVVNVPAWRLTLSRGASWLYRRILTNRLHTYTSCCRVYRRERVKDLVLQHGNFLGVVELLGQLDLQGGRIVEHPATLNVRLLGRSKMKTFRTICGHLRMMKSFLSTKLSGGQPRHSHAERDHALRLLVDTAGTTCHVGLTNPPHRPSASIGGQ
jgi:polysaccharide deacetylase family protein (PEP-CTERM system associated)